MDQQVRREGRNRGVRGKYQDRRCQSFNCELTYQPIHPPDAITDNLDPSKHLGALIPNTLPAPPAEPEKPSAPPPASVPVGQTSASATEPEEYVKPHLEQILSLHDFEAVARRTMNRRGWNYYSSGADDEITLRENHNAYGRVWFRPRVLRNVAKVDYSTNIFGYKTSMPVYVTATALGKSSCPCKFLSNANGSF